MSGGKKAGWREQGDGGAKEVRFIDLNRSKICILPPTPPPASRINKTTEEEEEHTRIGSTAEKMIDRWMNVRRKEIEPQEKDYENTPLMKEGGGIREGEREGLCK